MTTDLMQQCDIIIDIIKTQTKDSKDAGESYIFKIFNALSDSDKITIIKCIADCPECFKNHLEEKTTPTQKKLIDTEITDLDDYNTKELIRLKVWGIKVGIIVLILVSVLLILLSIILGSGVIKSTNSFINELEAIIGYLTN